MSEDSHSNKKKAESGTEGNNSWNENESGSPPPEVNTTQGDEKKEVDENMEDSERDSPANPREPEGCLPGEIAPNAPGMQKHVEEQTLIALELGGIL
ncbi:hypothetical protein R1flu_002462 [Riccia fluitans]|uniref:Uncharacterized protein n=1 Tax=Riccia fluitans TaxID=41844 RepID=A0ABD1Y668_9MARC